MDKTQNITEEEVSALQRLIRPKKKIIRKLHHLTPLEWAKSQGRAKPVPNERAQRRWGDGPGAVQNRKRRR